MFHIIIRLAVAVCALSSLFDMLCERIFCYPEVAFQAAHELYNENGSIFEW